MKPALAEIVRGFERTSGHKVAIDYATAGVVAGRIRSGEHADAIILPSSTFEPLAKEGKVVADSAKPLARSLMAIAVRKGAPKPDISTVEALKRTLLAARSIGYSDPTRGGGIGRDATRIVQQLGLAEQLKAKTTLTPAGEFRELLAKGEVELAFVLPVAIADQPGVELVGPVPAELQHPTDFMFKAGLSSQAKDVGAAQSFIEHLKAPEAVQVIKAKGMEPA
jgi:molybdate transport system substrate-binding protein